MKVSAKGSGGDFENAPAGMHVARCYRVIDLGTQATEWKGKKKETHKVLIGWELCMEKMSDGRPFTVNQRYTANLGEKANLRADLKSWRGRDFTPEELESFDLKAIIGKPCMLNIVHEAKDGKTYVNISAVTPMPAGMTAPPLVNPTQHLELEPGVFDQSVFDELSERLQETIASSPEYKALFATEGATERQPGDDEEDWG